MQLTELNSRDTKIKKTWSASRDLWGSWGWRRERNEGSWVVTSPFF